jgi:hypothetical protein
MWVSCEVRKSSACNVVKLSPFAFPVMYDYYLHIKSIVVSITGRGGIYGSDIMGIPRCL